MIKQKLSQTLKQSSIMLESIRYYRDALYNNADIKTLNADFSAK